MKRFLLAVVFLGLVSSMAVAAKADDHHGDQAAVAASKYIIVYNGYGTDGLTVDKDKDVSAWKKILSTVIDAKADDDGAFLINVSAVTGIFTANVNVNYVTDFTALLDAARIQVAVKVDDKWATPGLVTFDSLLHFNASAGTPAFLTIDLSGETGARSFDFYQVGIGKTKNNDHKVEVFARVCIDADAFSKSGLALTDAAAIIGSRTLTVETANVDLDETKED